MTTEENQKKKVGKANYEHMLAKVEGLKALKMTNEGKAWLEEFVPSKSEHGKALNKELRKAVTEDVDKFLDETTFQLMEDNLDKAKTCLVQRIGIYTKVLLDSDDAQKQVCTLIGLLDSMFRAGYKNIRDTWILIRDKDALLALDTWCRDKGSLPVIFGNENNIISCYFQACQPTLREKYEKMLKEIAEASKGQVKLVPVKAPFRALEKTAMRHKDQDRFKSDNLYDVVRGCIVFHDMASLLVAAQLIFALKTFKVLRIIDRFNAPTSSGWCDVMINGRFTGANQVGSICTSTPWCVCVCVRVCSLSCVAAAFGKAHTYVTLL